jgi:CBS domain-containing protein
MTKLVAEAMTTDPSAVARTSAVVEAARIMLHDDVGSVPVVDGETLVGIITDRDIAIRVVAAGHDPADTRVEEVASADLHCAVPDESLDDAYERMTTWQIRRLPVVAGGRLVGMLAQADLVHELKDRKAGQLVDEISRPGERAFRQQAVGLE